MRPVENDRVVHTVCKPSKLSWKPNGPPLTGPTTLLDPVIQGVYPKRRLLGSLGLERSPLQGAPINPIILSFLMILWLKAKHVGGVPKSAKYKGP